MKWGAAIVAAGGLQGAQDRTLLAEVEPAQPERARSLRGDAPGPGALPEADGAPAGLVAQGRGPRRDGAARVRKPGLERKGAAGPGGGALGQRSAAPSAGAKMRASRNNPTPLDRRIAKLRFGDDGDKSLGKLETGRDRWADRRAALAAHVSTRALNALWQAGVWSPGELRRALTRTSNLLRHLPNCGTSTEQELMRWSGAEHVREVCPKCKGRGILRVAAQTKKRGVE